MQSQITQQVARYIDEDRLRAARSRREARAPRRSPPRLRRSFAVLAIRIARRLDAESARRAIA